MKRRLLYMALWMIAGLLVTWAGVYAVDRLPPGTIPPIDEPWRQLTYCPIHALEGFRVGNES